MEPTCVITPMGMDPEAFEKDQVGEARRRLAEAEAKYAACEASYIKAVEAGDLHTAANANAVRSAAADSLFAAKVNAAAVLKATGYGLDPLGNQLPSVRR